MLTLAPGEAVSLSHLYNDAPGVDFDGNECNPPVPSGTEVEVTYEIDSLVGATVCGPDPVIILAP